jgi:signal transduction histidine kinase
MIKNNPDLTRGLRTAAWIWLAYLAILFGIDTFMYASPIRSMLLYYLANSSIALVFLAFSYWPWVQKVLKKAYMPVMLLIISTLPILASRLWNPHVVQGPMTNLEGTAIRMMPVLFIGVVIAAWHYSWPVVAIYAIGTSVLEMGIIPFLPKVSEPNNTVIVFFVSIIRSVSFLVVGYYISHLMNRLRDKQKQLVEANLQITHYASTLEQLTISRERNRMARELHDTLAHTLSALSVQLETTRAYWNVEPDTAYDLLTQTLEATRSGLNDTRRALKSLRASPLEDLGINLAIQNLTRSAKERGKLDVDLNMPNTLPSLSPNVEQCIYRVAQEAIENVLHHANAHTLSVKLAVDDDVITLTVEDDGMGMDAKHHPQDGHYGMKGMNERAQLAGGELDINSQPGQGTRILLTIEGIEND